MNTQTLTLALALALVGCSSTPAPETPESGATASVPEKSLFECPALDGRADFDLSSAFGIERPLAARIERMMRLASELEASAEKLRQETDALCSNLAGAFGEPPPEGANACEVALARTSTALPSLRAAGLSVRVGEIRCSLPQEALARCAGECITGKPDVFSRVTCSAPPHLAASLATTTTLEGGVEAAAASCGFDFSLPDASLECTTQCGVRALRDISCAAEVDVRFGDAHAQHYAHVAAVLRRDLPRIASLARSLMPQAVRVAGSVNGFVDDLGIVIDEMRSSASVERKAVVGAVLAGCVGPRLGSAVRAGANLQALLGDAERVRAQLMVP